MYNQNQFIIKIGRKATAAGLIGFLVGLIISFIFSFPTAGAIFTVLIFGYIFNTAFWGIHNLKMWYNKYRYQMPKTIWHFLKIFVYLLGILVGIIGYGFMEHFFLLLAMDQYKKGTGLIGAQIILLPYLGEIYSDKINYI